MLLNHSASVVVITRLLWHAVVSITSMCMGMQACYGICLHRFNFHPSTPPHVDFYVCLSLSNTGRS